MKTKKIMVIGVFILLVLVLVLYRPRIKIYDVPTAERGFILGARTEKTFVFFFYDHPTDEMTPLRPFETLYSNKLTVYTLSFSEDHEEQITVVLYRLETITTENETREVKRDLENFTTTLMLSQYKIVENVIELPTHTQEYQIELYTLEEKRIFKFQHETHPLFLSAQKYTLGSLFLDRLAYIVLALIVSLFSLGLAKVTVEKRGVVPQVSVGAGLWFMTMALIVLYISARVLIYKFGFLRLWWTYFPIVFCSYLFGFSILRPSTKVLYCLRTIEGSIPTKDVWTFEVVEVQNRFYLAKISWRDFLQGKKQALIFEGPVYWYWTIKDSANRLYVHKTIEEKENIHIELEGIHEIDVDKALSEIKKIEVLASEIQEWRVAYLSERAEKEVEVRKRLLDYVTSFEKSLEKEGRREKK